ncbi:MAG: PAS domain S-box protein [Nitrospirales bacterium]|nr:PAS domain S-box protein [Nitrospirales bacterium]
MERLSIEKDPFLSSIFDAIPAYVFIVDYDVRILYRNAAGARLLGLNMEQVYMKRGGEVLHCIHAEGAAEGCGWAEPCRQCVIRNTVAEALKGNRAFRKFSRMELRTDGAVTDAYFLVTATPFRYRGGKYVLLIMEDMGMVVTLEDLNKQLVEEIEDRRYAEGMLRRHLAAMEAAMDGMAIVSEAGCFVYLNNACLMMFGYDSPQELTGKSWDFVFDDEESPRFHSEIMPGLLHQGRWRGEAEGKDGSTFHMEISLAAIPEGGHVFVVRDITKRKQSEEFIRNILETVDEGFLVVDRDFRIVSANKAYGEQVKLPVAEIVGKHCHEISHHLPHPCFLSGDDCAVNHVFLKGEPCTVVHMHKDSYGNPVYVETKAYPVKDKNGQVTSAIEVVNDITEKKRLEEQLFQAQKMEAIGTLAGGIAHDFNNILTAIMGYGSLLKSKMEKDNPLENYVEQILSTTERATNLTQSLLAFSRRQVINLKPMNLNDIIRDIRKLLLRLVGEGIDLRLNLTEESLIIMADHVQIEQVLMNLVTNAGDAVSGSGVISIETRSVEVDEFYVKRHLFSRSGPHAMITVSDTGSGMDEKTKDNLFEPFFTTKEVGKGTGLGLAIVYGVVKQHNGNINVSSEPGKGTTFNIFFPMLKARDGEAKSPVIPPPARGEEVVLVAEDDEVVRHLIRDILTSAGYSVIEARDGEEAVEQYRRNMDRIKAILLDVIMPRKNGREAYQMMKTINPSVKGALFMSGYTADIIHNMEILESGLDFISKPVMPDDLLRRLREVLDK